MACLLVNRLSVDRRGDFSGRARLSHELEKITPERYFSGKEGLTHAPYSRTIFLRDAC
jgi:hypothetical protein